MLRDAVEDRSHAVLPDAETNVPSREIVAIEITAVLNVVHRRTVQVGATTGE